MFTIFRSQLRMRVISPWNELFMLFFYFLQETSFFKRKMTLTRLLFYSKKKKNYTNKNVLNINEPFLCSKISQHNFIVSTSIYSIMSWPTSVHFLIRKLSECLYSLKKVILA